MFRLKFLVLTLLLVLVGSVAAQESQTQVLVRNDLSLGSGMYEFWFYSPFDYSWINEGTGQNLILATDAVPEVACNVACNPTVQVFGEQSVTVVDVPENGIVNIDIPTLPHLPDEMRVNTELAFPGIGVLIAPMLADGMMVIVPPQQEVDGYLIKDMALVSDLPWQIRYCPKSGIDNICMESTPYWESSSASADGRYRGSGMSTYSYDIEMVLVLTYGDFQPITYDIHLGADVVGRDGVEFNPVITATTDMNIELGPEGMYGEFEDVAVIADHPFEAKICSDDDRTNYCSDVNVAHPILTGEIGKYRVDFPTIMADQYIMVTPPFWRSPDNKSSGYFQIYDDFEWVMTLARNNTNPVWVKISDRPYSGNQLAIENMRVMSTHSWVLRYCDIQADSNQNGSDKDEVAASCFLDGNPGLMSPDSETLHRVNLDISFTGESQYLGFEFFP
jgi:hypothetical protein